MTRMTSPAYPSSPMLALDTVWFQVAGTICNLQCAHCFISCSPNNRSHEMMTLAQVMPYLDEAERLGVREYYVTGGEPFMNPELLGMLEAMLRLGPTSVLTNGVLIRNDTARRLRRLSDSTDYSLDLRISLDGYDAATNDPIRGAGTFERIVAGIRCLAAAGLAPNITVTHALERVGTQEGRARFLRFLGEAGLPHPRLKVMPLLRLGAEQRRTRGYLPEESLRGLHLTREEVEALQCSSCRMVTARGVWVCPILIDSPDAMMGRTLAETLRPFELRHQACYTCHVMGLTCRT